MSLANTGLPVGSTTLPISDLSPYHYIPTRYVTITFVSLFGFSTAIHLMQAVMYRMWWLLPTVCFCGLLEILGWSARLWSSIDPFNITPYQIQITCTIVAPTPFIAANFIILGKIAKELGQAYSRLGPRWYSIVFFTCDFISLVAQAVGGAMAAMSTDAAGTNLGSNIMLGGIFFQLLVIITFSFCGIEYYQRYSVNLPVTSHFNRASNVDTIVRGICTEKVKHMAYAMVIMTTCLFIRAIYRTIELSDGWNGRVISTQIYFNIFDGAMVVLAIYTMNLVHPGTMLSGLSDENKIHLKLYDF